GLGKRIATWNSLLVTTVLSKVTSDTVWQWQLTLKDKEMPTYTELLEFLEKRANCCVIKQKIPIKQSGSDRTRPPRQSTFVTKTAVPGLRRHTRSLGMSKVQRQGVTACAIVTQSSSVNQGRAEFATDDITRCYTCPEKQQ
ncbi:unnamed protein product, partial [Heterotrigona itama]